MRRQTWPWDGDRVRLVQAGRARRGPWIFRSFAGSWIYRTTGIGETEVTFRYHVEARPKVGRLSDWVLERVFAREMRKRLSALKSSVETTDLLERFAAKRSAEI